MCAKAHAADVLMLGAGNIELASSASARYLCAGIPRLYHWNGAHRATLGERTPPTPSGAETAVCEPTTAAPT